ncbi:MAG: hypothetical protein ABR520_04760 [Mycobacteriales bacterium]|nr:hypothetical protein [Frankia sp.]
MGLVLLLIVAAIAIGAVSLLVSAIKWALIIALALFVAGLFLGWSRRGG